MVVCKECTSLLKMDWTKHGTGKSFLASECRRGIRDVFGYGIKGRKKQRIV